MEHGSNSCAADFKGRAACEYTIFFKIGGLFLIPMAVVNLLFSAGWHVPSVGMGESGIGGGFCPNLFDARFACVSRLKSAWTPFN